MGAAVYERVDIAVRKPHGNDRSVANKASFEIPRVWNFNLKGQKTPGFASKDLFLLRHIELRIVKNSVGNPGYPFERPRERLS
jgi:hypothetical protein